MGVKITDLVDQSAFDQLKELDGKLADLRSNYASIARELAGGIQVKIEAVGDLDKLNTLIAQKAQEAQKATTALNGVVEQQQQVMAKTTAQIAETLQKEAALTDSKRKQVSVNREALDIADRLLGSYGENIKQLASLSIQLKQVSAEQAAVTKALKDGNITQTQAAAKMADITKRQMELSKAKQELTKIINNETKLNQASEGSYQQLSLVLERLKMAMKSVSAEQIGTEQMATLQEAVQSLDTELKYQAELMGEHQRNVGDYAIALQNAGISADEAQVTIGKANEALTVNATTVDEARSQNEALSKALTLIDKNSEGAKDKITQYNAKIKENEQFIKDNTESSNTMVNILMKLLGINVNLNNTFVVLGRSAASGGSIMQGVTAKVKGLSSAMVGLLANPYVLALLGLAAVAGGFKWWVDYNTGLMEASRLTKYFSGLSGDEMKSVRDNVQAVADTFGQEFKPTLVAANALAKNFGLTFNEAVNIVSDGLALGGRNSQDFMSNIQRYAPTFEKMGVSGKDFVAVLSQIDKTGVMSTKALQGLSKASLQLRTMSNSTAQAINAIGLNAQQMSQDIASGKTNVMDAMSQISAKVVALGTNSQKSAEVMKQLFGSRGESSIGKPLLEMLAQSGTSMDDLKKKSGEMYQLINKQKESQERVNNLTATLFDQTGGGFEKMKIGMKTLLNDALAKVLQWIIDAYNWFVELYNESYQVRVMFASMGVAFNNSFEIIKYGLKNIWLMLKTTANVLKDILTGNWDKVGGEMTNAFKEGTKNASHLLKNLQGVETAITNANAKQNRLNKLTAIGAKSAAAGGVSGGQVGSGGTGTGGGKAGGKSGGTGKNEVDEAKRLQEEIENVKIEIMSEGWAKQEAMIKKEYAKRKEDAKGNAELISLLEVAEAKKLADKRKEFSEQAEATDIANRLLVAKKGSDEERALRYAQLEAEHRKAVEEANKTGADVEAVNAAFVEKRKQLDEEMANENIERISKEYAKRNEELNTSLSQELLMLRQHYNEELVAAGGNAEKRAEIEEQYQRKVQEISDKYQMQQTSNLIASLNEQLQDADISADKREEIERQLANAKIKLGQQMEDAAKKANDSIVNDDNTAMERRLKNLEAWASKAQEVCSNVSALFSAVYDGQIQHIEDLQEAESDRYDKEVESIESLANQGAITTEEAELRKREAQAKTEEKNKELAEQKRKLQYKQAVLDKMNSISQIGISTALGIMRALAMFPPNVGLATFIGAMGAVQTATALAQPIQYAEGTKGTPHKGGYAVVGDGNKTEVVTLGGKMWLTPDTPTLVDLPRGAQVYPSVDDYARKMDFQPITHVSDSTPNVVVNNDYKALEREMQRNGRLLKGINKQMRLSDRNRKYDQYRASKL